MLFFLYSKIMAMKPFASQPSSIFAFTVKDRFGKDFSLAHYAGRVCVIVNTASQCGLTPMNMPQLQLLAQHYESKPFSIIAFPSRSFHQEPKEACEVHDWAKQSYGATFDVMGHVLVKGPRTDPLFAMLTMTLGAPKWNFDKYLCDADGIPRQHFAAHTDPMQMVGAIDGLLPAH